MPDTLADDAFGLGTSGTASAYFVVSVSGLTTSPTYGQTAQIGTPLYACAHHFSDAAPDSVAWQWHDNTGAIAGATGAAYTPGPGDDLENLYPVATPGGPYAPRSGPAHTARFAAPVPAGGLPDVGYAVDTGNHTVAAADGFLGEELAYSVTTGLPGVAIDSGTGVVSIGTGDGTQSGTITITAANSGGAAQSSFAVTIASAATVPARMSKPTVTANGPTSLRIGLAAAPDDGGSAITSYDLRWREEGGIYAKVLGISDPEVLTGLETGVVYQLRTRAVNAIGPGPWSPLETGSPEDIVAPGPLPDIVTNTDDTVDIMVDEGDFTVTVSGASLAHHNGTHGPFLASDPGTGPLPAVAPLIDGIAVHGETLTALPGLWIHEAGDPPVIAGVWRRNGIDIAGATGSTYVVNQADGGETITYAATATNAAGSRTQIGNGIAIPVATVPERMAAPTVTATGSDSISASLAAAPNDGGSAITSYDLRWQADGGGWTTVTGISDPETVAGLTADTLYNVQTRAVNAIGAGPWSASGSATTNAASGGLTFVDDFTGYTLGETVYQQPPYDSPAGYSYCHIRDAGGTRVARQEWTLQTHTYVAQTVSDDREVALTAHEIPAGAGGPWALYLSYTDANNFIELVSDTGGYYTLTERVSGSNTTHYSSNPYPALVQGDELRIRLSGGVLQAFKNASQIGSDYALASSTPLGQPGFRLSIGGMTGNTSISEFRVEEL